MRGVKSFAMLLCVSKPSPESQDISQTHIDRLQATAAEGKEGGIEFVRPPAGSKPGERIYFEGEKYESEYIHTYARPVYRQLDPSDAQPEPLLNPKKKVFETVQPVRTPRTATTPSHER